jgi:hypothetical protein
MKNSKLLNDLQDYFLKFQKEDNDWTKRQPDKSLFTYGSTPYETFIKLLDRTTIKPKRFVVVGCSIGWINFYWNELYPEIKTIGIDIHAPRVKFAKKMIADYNLKNIEIKSDSFSDFKFEEGDLIWQSNLCFPNKEVYRINKAIKKIPNIGIISYKRIFRKQFFEHYNPDKIEYYQYPVSWGKQSFYIYEKL